MSKDPRTDAEVEASLKRHLVDNGMPPECVDRACDMWCALLEASPSLLERMESDPENSGRWSQYAFFQGFCAGYRAMLHHN